MGNGRRAAGDEPTRDKIEGVARAWRDISTFRRETERFFDQEYSIPYRRVVELERRTTTDLVDDHPGIQASKYAAKNATACYIRVLSKMRT